MRQVTETLDRFDAGLVRNAAATLSNPRLLPRVLEALPAGLLQQVAVAALVVLQERAEREPWVSELIEEVAASVGRCGLPC